MEDLYILDGVELTYDQIDKDAKEAKMGFNEYVALKGIETKQPEVEEEEKTVVVEEPIETTVTKETVDENVELEKPIDIETTTVPQTTKTPEVEIVKWNPSVFKNGEVDTEYYENLPIMDREYQNFEQWKSNNAIEYSNAQARNMGLSTDYEDIQGKSYVPSIQQAKYLADTKEREKLDEEAEEKIIAVEQQRFNQGYKPQRQGQQEDVDRLNKVEKENKSRQQETAFEQLSTVGGVDEYMYTTDDLYSDNDNAKKFLVLKYFPDKVESTTSGFGQFAETDIQNKDATWWDKTKNLTLGFETEQYLYPLQKADISRGGASTLNTLQNNPKLINGQELKTPDQQYDYSINNFGIIEDKQVDPSLAKLDAYLSLIGTDEFESIPIIGGIFKGAQTEINKSLSNQLYASTKDLDEAIKFRNKLKEGTEAYDNYTDKIDNLSSQVNALRSRLNAGEKLYDENGNLLNIDYTDYEFSEEESNNINNQAKEYQQTIPTVDLMKSEFSRLFFELQYVDRQISGRQEEVYEGSTELLTDIGGVPLPNLPGIARYFRNLTSGGRTLEDPLKATEATKDFTFEKGKNLKIESSHPLARHHNEILMQMYALERAIKLNSNLMTINDEQNLAQRFLEKSAAALYLDSQTATIGFADVNYLGSESSAAKIMGEVFKGAGLELDKEVFDKYDVNEEGLGEGAVDLVAGMMPLLTAISGGKGIKLKITPKGFKGKPTTYGVKPVMNRMDAYARTIKKGKGRVTRSVVNLMNSAAKEVMTIGAANTLGEKVFDEGYEPMPLTDAVLFGMGNSVVAGIGKSMFGRFIPYLTPLSRSKIGVGFSVVGKPVVGGVSATAIGKAVQAANLTIDSWNGGDEELIAEQWEEWGKIDGWAKEIIGFGALGVRGELFTTAKKNLDRINTTTARTKKAAEFLGVNEFSTPEEIAAAKKKKKGELGLAFLPLNKKKTQEQLDALKELDAAESVLVNQSALKEAKDFLIENDNNIFNRFAKAIGYSELNSRMQVISEKIASGKNLKVSEMEILNRLGEKDMRNGKTNYLPLATVIGEIFELDGKSILPMVEQYGNIGSAVYASSPGQSRAAKNTRTKLANIIQDRGKAISEIETLKEQNKSTKDATQKAINETRIKELEQKSKELSEQYILETQKSKEQVGKDLQSDIDFWEPIAKELGIDFKVVDQNMYSKIANGEMKINGKTFDFKENSDAQTILSPGEKPLVIINKSMAAKTGAISVATHEMIHALLAKQFKNANGVFTEQARVVLNDFYNSLSKSQKDAIDNRLVGIYGKGTAKFESVKLEEILTVFMDAVRQGRTKMNSGLAQSLGNMFSNLPGVKNKAIDLTSAKGVKDFLKVLDKSQKIGELDPRIKEMWEKGGEVEVESQFQSESFGKEFDAKAEIDVTKKEWDAGGYEKAFKMVDEGILDGQIIQDVGKNKIPIRGEKIVIQDKEFSKREFIEDVRSEIKTVIRNFNPEVNKSLLGWINNPKNFTNKRKVVFEAYEKIALGEKAARGEGRAEIELIPQRPVEPAGAGRTESMKLLSAAGRAELIEKVRTSIPEVPEVFEAYLNTFKNKLKDIPNLAAKELAKEIGIPENKITDPADNLSKSEAFKAQRWLMSNMNYAKAIDLMPFNNVPVFKEYAYKPGTTQKIRHPKSRKGENFIYVSVADKAMLNQPTGLFGNIKRDFFTKTDQRIGNDFLWTKNEFSEKYFLEKVGIKDRKKAETFTQRTSEAQTLKGVLNYISKDMTLKAMSEKADRLGLQNEVNNLRSGKNVYAASESYVSKLPEFVQNDFMFNRVSDIAREFKVIYNGSPKDAKEVKAVVDRIMKGQVAKMGEFEYVYKNEDTKAISDAIFKAIKQARTSPRMQESIKLQNEAAVRNVQDFINERLDFIVNSPEKVNEAFWKAKDLAKEAELGERITVQREVSKAFFSDYIFKAEDKAQAIENIVSLGEQFFSASGIGGGRYQFFENVSDFRNELNSVIKDMGLDLTVTDKNTIVNSKGEVISKIKRFGKTQHKSDHALKLLKKSFGKDGNIDLKNSKVRKNVEEVVDFYENLAFESRKMLDAQMEFFMSEFKAGNIDNVDMALYTMTLKSGMGTILRMAAPLREIYNVLPGEARQMKTSVNGEKVLIWEHSKAAEKFLYEMLDVYMKPENMTDGKLNESGKTKMQNLYENYYVTIMPYAFDTKITKLGYQVAEPTEGTRYHNKDTFGLKESRSTTNLITGEVKGEAWAEAAMNAINPKLAKENLKSDPISFASESNTKTNIDFLDAAKNHDVALAKAKMKNKVPKKIRVFDFDDTMAKTKSLVFYNKPSTTKEVKPKLKAIVMAGPPGGGKSNVIKGLDLVKDGFKEVNQDISLEWLKTKEGLPAKEADYTKEQRSVRSKLGAEARKIAARKLDKFSKQGDGIILDGTGASLKATESKVKALEDLGYDVSMVYVSTPKEIALQRNKNRAERSLPDFIVEKTWDAVNANREAYAGRFGNKFYEVNTEGLKQGEVPKEIYDALRNDLAAKERGRLTAEEFAKDGKRLAEEGFKMDFSDFNIVREGERGPLFEVAERIRDARGTEDVFILTARAPESAPAIKEFLKSEGLDIPLENITGLGNSTGEAKAQWIVGKAAEGYNDFYFADDAIANVKAVKEALAPLDVKSKVQQAFASESEVKSIEFNKLLEQSTGIEYYKEYSAAKAKTIGASKGKFKFWIPYSAEDFQGLIYPTLAKGKLGDKQMAWYKTNLLNPYARAMDNLSRDRVQLMSDFKALKKQLDVPKDLRKKNNTGFTNEQAVRVYLYNKAGHEVPGLSKADLRELLDVVNSDGKLQAFAEQILTLTKGDGYVKPNENWLVGTITTDLINLLNTTKRGKYLEEWQSNVDQIYSKENLNKLEAIYGPKYREALENILARMKAGRNRLASGGRLSNQILDYINGSNAAIMFFNTRSAVLQTISSINFVNWSFNNPIKAGAAFANQPQYWKDFVKLMNSDYLLDRRNGLRLNIAENEIADAAATSKNKVKGALRYILEKGYLPTQYADSFAIASGGATFYRNRINDLVKKGINVKEAEAQAYLEWRQIAEESQQSSDPSKISQQQASDAGRLILMFANTPMQYARLQKRAFQDLVNGRGDAKANLSKIAYYGFVQNMMFNALQNALMKLGFDDEDNDEEKEKRYFRTANGMLDTTLRGLGIGGAAISVAKNFLLDIYERSGRKRPEYVDSMWKLLQFSPPISSKISKLRQAAWAFDSKKRREEIFSKGFSLDNPAVMAGAKVISATTNVPLDRVLQKADNIEGALSEEADWWQSTLMLGGWPRWDIMPDRDEYVSKPKTQEEKDKIKENKDKNKYKAAKGSTDFETIKALTKAQQEQMLKDLGYGSRAIKNAKKEADRIKLIQEANKNP